MQAGQYDIGFMTQDYFFIILDSYNTVSFLYTYTTTHILHRNG